MTFVLRRLWNEQDGAILSAEIVLVASILVLGTIVGLASLRDAIVTELADVAQAIANIDQSFSFSSVTGHHTFTAGSVFNDTLDFCDGIHQNDHVRNSKCVVICTNAVHPGGCFADGSDNNNGGSM
jgi:hypothetical protein